jgi:hypothetical protein
MLCFSHAPRQREHAALVVPTALAVPGLDAAA